MPPLMLRGWLLEAERLALRRWSFGLDCLEMGAYEGLSTCNIAATAQSLVTIDTFDGRGTPEPKDTEAILRQNVLDCSRTCEVEVHKGFFHDVVPTLNRTFDMVFVDGSHDYQNVLRDSQLALSVLRPGGVIAFHDYQSCNPEVVQVVDRLMAEGWKFDGQEDSLVRLRPDGKRSSKPDPKLYIAVPHRDGWVHWGTSAACLHGPSKVGRTVDPYGSSVLTQTFNRLLSNALNARDREGYTHFVMLHNDVVPKPGFYEVLLREMTAHKLDVVSALVPLKDERGLTSTAVDTPGNPWGNRRLTMSEAMELPETFSAEDVPFRQPDSCLLLNSGCWIMPLDEPWTRGLHFRQQDRIVWGRCNQEWIAQSISEDWDFSRQLWSRGVRMGCTRAVELFHQIPQYTNQKAWGTWIQDEDFIKAEAEVTAYHQREADHGRGQAAGVPDGDAEVEGDHQHRHDAGRPDPVERPGVGPAAPEHADYDRASGLVGAVG